MRGPEYLPMGCTLRLRLSNIELAGFIVKGTVTFKSTRTGTQIPRRGQLSPQGTISFLSGLCRPRDIFQTYGNIA